MILLLPDDENPKTTPEQMSAYHDQVWGIAADICDALASDRDAIDFEGYVEEAAEALADETGKSTGPGPEVYRRALRLARRDQPQTCPECGVQATRVGSLGQLLHYQCRNCGTYFHRALSEVEND